MTKLTESAGAPDRAIAKHLGGETTAGTRATIKHNSLEVKYWPIDWLIPFAGNARTHSEKQIAEIAGSIRAFGFANPILVGEDREIIAGHGRLAAARLLELDTVPVIVLRGLTEVQRRQLVLADNRIALNAGWDEDVLRLELRDLASIDADLKLVGFTKAELAAALRGGVRADGRGPGSPAIGAPHRPFGR